MSLKITKEMVALVSCLCGAVGTLIQRSHFGNHSCVICKQNYHITTVRKMVIEAETGYSEFPTIDCVGLNLDCYEDEDFDDSGNLLVNPFVDFNYTTPLTKIFKN